MDPAWAASGGLPVHAIHLPDQPWGPALGETALAALRTGLQVDFLVLRAADPGGRAQAAAFLAVLEGLLEVTQGRGPRIVLRPEPGAARGLADRLREVRGEAVGFCWDPGLTPDLAWVEDRIYCAVGGAGDDFGPIQRLGYRWNVAVPATDPESFRAEAAAILRRFPPVLFPAGPAPDRPEAP